MYCKKTRILAFLCAVALLLGAMPVMALSGNPTDTDQTVPVHDVKVMSFNILEYDTTNNGYDVGSKRIDAVIKTVEKYQPDVVGMQEVSNAKYATATTNVNYYDWLTKLPAKMADLGYSCRKIMEDCSALSPNQSIGAGLVIFYKSDRFTFASSAAAKYTNASYSVYSSGAKTGTESGRAWQYIKLKDKNYDDQPIYVFNTHLSIDPTSSLDSDAQKAAGNLLRTQEAAELAAKMKEVAGDSPCFATGDYNSAWDRSSLGYIGNYNKNVPSGSSYDKYRITEEQINVLYQMTDGGFADAGRSADNVVTTNWQTVIDHTFYNPTAAKAIEHHTVYDTFNGVQPSDHRAIITYFNYRRTGLTPNIYGTYDDATKTLRDTASSNAFYTFNFSDLPSGATVQIKNDDTGAIGTSLSEVALSGPVSHFTITVIKGGKTYGTYKAVISSVATKPSVTAGSLPYYYANDAWHVVLTKSQDSASLSFTGTLYSDSACTKSVNKSLTGIPGGVTTYYAKNGGLPVAVKICKETADKQSGTLYCDDDINENYEGTVAFCTDDGTVIIGTNNSEMFGSLEAALHAAKSGNTIRFAPGEYQGGNMSAAWNTAPNLTLLGNNADISPIAKSDTAWTKSAARKEESIIRDGIRLLANNTNLYYTVKGFSFTGGNNNGAVVVATGSTPSADKVYTVDIEQNIFDEFEGQGNSSNNTSFIHLNVSNCQKVGIIRDNYMKAYRSNGETYTATNPPADIECPMRGIFVRSPGKKPKETHTDADYLIVEDNLMAGLNNPLYVMSEPFNKATIGGNGLIKVRYNRFENCGGVNVYLYNILEENEADVQVLYNDFVRCGAGNTSKGSFGISALYFTVEETETCRTSSLSTYYENCKINVFGNRFTDCMRSVQLYRDNLGNGSGDLSKLTLDVHQNRFINSNTYTNNGNLGVDITKVYDIYLPAYLTYANFSSKNKSQTVPTKWNFDYNYYQSGTEAQPARFTPNGYFTAPSAAYYKDIDMTTGSKTVGTLSGITASGVTKERDGTAYGITVSGVPTDAYVSYAYSPVPNVDPATLAYGAQNPVFSDPGTYPVYYQVEKSGYKLYTGSATVTILTPILDDMVTFEGQTLTYDGQPHTLTAIAPEAANISYTYGGATTATPPEFTDVGSYDITVKVTMDGYADFTATKTLTINTKEMEGVTVTGFAGEYDGNGHSVTVTGAPSGAAVQYAVDGGGYSTDAPEYSAVGTHTVDVKITLKNYATYTKTVSISITKATTPDYFDDSVIRTPLDALAPDITPFADTTITYTVGQKTVTWHNGDEYPKIVDLMPSAEQLIENEDCFTVQIKLTNANLKSDFERQIEIWVTKAELLYEDASDSVAYDGKAHSFSPCETTKNGVDLKLYYTVNDIDVGATQPYFIAPGSYRVDVWSGIYNVNMYQYIGYTVTGSYDSGIAADAKWANGAYTVEVTGTQSGDTVLYDGQTTAPTFTDGKAHTVNVIVNRTDVDGKAGIIFMKTVAIQPPKAKGYSGVYNGNPHGITLIGIPDGAVTEYLVDGVGAYTTTEPKFTDVCEHTVAVCVTYEQTVILQTEVSVKITPRLWNDFHPKCPNDWFEYDGKPHSFAITGLPADVTLEYSFDEKNWTTEVPSSAVCMNAYGDWVMYVRATADNFDTPSHIYEFYLNTEGIYSWDENLQLKEAAVAGGRTVKVESALAGSAKLYYFVDQAPCTEKPVLIEPGEYTVDVIAVDGTKASHGRITLTVVPDLFRLTLSPAEVTADDNNAGYYKIKWQLTVDLNTESEYLDKDVNVLSYGIFCAASEETLQKQLAGEDQGKKVIQNVFRENNGLSLDKIYKTTNYTLTKVAENKMRCAVCYIVYEIDGDPYTQVSLPDGTTTILGGAITGDGGEVIFDDDLDD